MPNRAEARAWNPSLSERIGNMLYDFGMGVGFSPTHANRMREEARTAADFVPGVGEAVGADQMGRDLAAGNLGDAALGAAGLAIPGLTLNSRRIKPGVVYDEMFHGTASPDHFQELLGNLGDRGGVHVTPDTDLASMYATGRAEGNNRIYPVLADLGQPLNLMGQGDKVRTGNFGHFVDAVRSSADRGQVRNLDEVMKNLETAPMLEDALKQSGYDSIKYNHAMPQGRRDADAYMLFDNEQVLPRFTPEARAAEDMIIPGNRKPPISDEDFEYLMNWIREAR